MSSENEVLGNSLLNLRKGRKSSEEINESNKAQEVKRERKDLAMVRELRNRKE